MYYPTKFPAIHYSIANRLLNSLFVLILANMLCFAPKLYASGFSDKISSDPQVQNAIDAVESALKAAVTKGKITRGASGTISAFLLNADSLACSAWVMTFNIRYRNLVINKAPIEVLKAAMQLKAKIEYACRKILDPDTYNELGVNGGSVDDENNGGSMGNPDSRPYVYRPGWSIEDEICWRKCSDLLYQYNKAQGEADKAQKAADQTKKEAARVSRDLKDLEARLKKARDTLNEKVKTFYRTVSPVQQKYLNEFHQRQSAARRAVDFLPGKIAAKQRELESKNKTSATLQRAADRLQKAADAARRAYEECVRNCYKDAKKPIHKRFGVASSSLGAPLELDPNRLEYALQDHRNNIYVSTPLYNAVLRINAEDQIDNVYLHEDLDQPAGIAHNPLREEVYVASSSMDLIVVFNENGQYLRSLKSACISMPAGLALGSDGNLFVSSHGLGQICQLSPEGELLNSFSDDTMGDPADIAFDSMAQELYVVDNTNAQVLVFDAMGLFKRLFAYGEALVSPWSIALEGGQYADAHRIDKLSQPLSSVIVSDMAGQALVAFSPEGEIFDVYPEHSMLPMALAIQIPVDFMPEETEKIDEVSTIVEKLGLIVPSDSLIRYSVRTLK
jgi:hypothetical protein